MPFFGTRPASAVAIIASAALAAATLHSGAAWAGSAQIVDVEQGATPFVGFAGAVYTGGTIASVSFSVVPKSGSVTRPIGGTYSANYLTTHNYFVPGASAVVIPIFGLYAGYSNTIGITYKFVDGTSFTQAATLNTSPYTDPCPQINQRTFVQYRASTSSLNYDYFLLKDYCSANSPAIFDTDGNIRWIGSGGAGIEASNILNNAVYLSDGKTGINRVDISTGQSTKLADYASINVTATNQHNIDIGRSGLLIEVNTTAQLEAAALEINPTTGAVLESWDFGAIISAAMTAGGDSPAKFVLGTNADWFHNNALAYNPADNTLIVSSRENFVMAVDYDMPASGQRQIHWILGDTTKLWATYPSLAKLSLTLANASTLPPIGQHAVSIDHQGNLLLFDDGLGSLTLSPPGITRNYSAVRSYQINTQAKTATEINTFTENLFSPICSSAYDVGGNYLVDFANARYASSATVGEANSTIAAGLSTNGGTSLIMVGFGNSSQVEFLMQIPSPTPCEMGWNAFPLSSNLFTFN